MADEEIVFPVMTEESSKTHVKITYAATAAFAEKNMVGTTVRHGNRDVPARITAVRLFWYWSTTGSLETAGGWVFDSYSSRVTVQRRTLNGWGKPIVRTWGREPDVLLQRTQHLEPSQMPEVVWHG